MVAAESTAVPSGSGREVARSLHVTLVVANTFQFDSRQLRTRAAAVRVDALDRLVRADDVLSRSVDTVRRHRHLTLKKAHRRGDTINPPVAPPTLVCPLCDKPLTYRRSHVGGVSSKHSEQWDYFDCEAGCGTFQYRVRTRKLRKAD